MNRGDSITVFVQSDESLPANSLVDVARFTFSGTPFPAQSLLPVSGIANRYSATRTIRNSDHGESLSLVVRGVRNADGNLVTDLTVDLQTRVTIDTRAPAIELAGNSAVTVAHGVEYSDDGVRGLDTAAGEQLETAVVGPGSETTVNTRVAGAYTITYTATDRAGNTDTETRTVTVSDPPAAKPIADAGADVTLATNAEMTLDGSSSNSVGQTINFYTWTQTVGDQVDLDVNALRPTATFTAPVAAAALPPL